MKYPGCIVVLCLIGLPSAFGQMMKCSMASGSVFTGLDGNYKATITYNPLPIGNPGMLPGRPYSAEEIAQRTQTLPDGAKVVDPRPSTFHYRDSAGRTRTERPLSMSSILNRADIPSVPEIFDPVDGYCYYLDTVNHVAHRILLPQTIRTLAPPQGVTFPVEMPAILGPRPNAAAAADTRSNVERLGVTEIEGVEAAGLRTTTTFPAGAFGNDQPVTTSRETWISAELNATVLSKVTDPRQGEDIQALVNISLEEPDASLFTVPRGYKVVDQELPFAITFTGASDKTLGLPGS